MKKNKIYIVIFIILLPVAVYFYLAGDKSTLKSKDKDFSIEDTSGINAIVIAGEKDTTRMIKHDHVWKLNKNYYVSRNALKYFLSTQKRITVKSPVSRERHGYISAAMDSAAIRVMIDRDRKKDKHYEVYKNPGTGDTYMRMYSSKHIFKVYIPAYGGIVADLYTTETAFWRSKLIFGYNYKNIDELEIHYPGNTAESFLIMRDKSENIFFEGEKADTKKKKKINSYFFEYRNVQCYQYIDSIAGNIKQNLMEQGPLCRIKIKDRDDHIKVVKFYNKPLEKDFENLGAEIGYDPHKMYGFNEHLNEWFIIRYVTLAPLLKKKQDF